MYKITTLYDGTRIRAQHTTFAEVLKSVPADTLIGGDDLWIAEQDGAEVRAGDCWLHVHWAGVTGWMAHTHKGVSLCKNLTEVPKPATANVSEVMRRGRIARLRSDWLNPKWEYQARSLKETWRGLSSPPQTVTFNDRMRDGKGAKIPLTSWMDYYLLKLNGAKAYSGWKEPKTGWINVGRFPEALSFGGNDVIVKEVRGKFASVHALDCFAEDVTDTFFTPNGRLVIHKFTAVTRSQKLIKMGPALDAYMPFMKNSDAYWIPLEYLEFYPALPFRLTDGSVVTEYLLLGDETWGLTEAGKVCLYNPREKYTTNWVLENPPVPPAGESLAADGEFFDPFALI